MELLVRSGRRRLQALTVPPGSSGLHLKRRCCEDQGLPIDDTYLTYNGKLVSENGELHCGGIYSLETRLCGGKGGFGSMLRALGAQIEKTTNREACRDLSGRRLRDVNHEKAMAEWIKKQAEREAEKEQKRLERLQRKLAEPKHYFTDPQYEQQLDEISERLEDSVIKGLQASSSDVVSAEGGALRKRPHSASKREAKGGKRKCLWMGLEDLDDSGNSDEEQTGDSSSTDESSSSSGSCVEPGGLDNGTRDDTKECAGPSGSSWLPAGEEEKEDPAAQPEPSGKGQAEASCSQTGNQLETREHIKESPERSESNEKEDAQENANSPKSSEPEPLDWRTLDSAGEVESLGLERLKTELMGLGLKCGGTLQERAERLFSVRGMSKDEIDPTLFAKAARGKKPR
ncbi:replication stress response regulator SDE2 [Callorhinchus milii]|uniref:Replication stress response regulator SDE2 n=1 Tax=Callorhinchus milii TaxID=7868 RepID=A0A4W3JN26_CALMI|nr:replication stress response regulator SDE2 [Callorhinchus milii]|eukprot:gi/632960935/ref/XP_007896478.1/ PREDICTED: protein SDE2 homolog [Callorhinchus milii]